MRNSTGQDIDRPHYYSQFWLDVAEGKQTDQTALSEAAPEAPSARAQIATLPNETFEDEPTLAAQAPIAAEPVAPPAEPARKAAKPEKEKKEPARVTSLSELARIQELMRSSAEMEDTATPNLEAEGTDLEEPDIITDFALGDDVEAPEYAAENEAEEDFGDEFEDEEEEDEWGGGGGGGGGRKPRKPTKPPRRDRPSRF